jgi:hypothetical protein
VQAFCSPIATSRSRCASSLPLRRAAVSRLAIALLPSWIRDQSVDANENLPTAQHSTLLKKFKKRLRCRHFFELSISLKREILVGAAMTN